MCPAAGGGHARPLAAPLRGLRCWPPQRISDQSGGVCKERVGRATPFGLFAARWTNGSLPAELRFKGFDAEGKLALESEHGHGGKLVDARLVNVAAVDVDAGAHHTRRLPRNLFVSVTAEDRVLKRVEPKRTEFIDGLVVGRRLVAMA